MLQYYLEMKLTYNLIVYHLNELAKTNRYLSLYRSAKDNVIKLFDNNSLTHIQLLFLNFLIFHYDIRVDIGAGEVTEKVLENDIRLEAYSVYRSNKSKKEKQKVGKENLKHKHSNKETKKHVSSKTLKFRPRNN